MTAKTFSLASTLGLLCASAVLCGYAALAHADNWEIYESKTKLFNMITPTEPDEEFEKFRIDSKYVAYSSEAVSNIDQRPYMNAVKRYTAKVTQTFGPGMSIDKSAETLKRVIERYKAEYEKKGGIIREEKATFINGLPGAELFISYEDEELGLQSMKVQLLVTDSTVFEQILLGPDSIIAAPSSKNFLLSFKPIRGKIYEPGNMSQEWRTVVPPLKTFKIKAPPITLPYVLDDPKQQASDNTELVSLVFNDPVREEKLYYNVYGYRFEKDIAFADASKILAEKHIARHNRGFGNISFKRSFENDQPHLSTVYSVKGPKGYEYLNTVELYAVFIGKYLVVQEVMGSQTLVNSEFMKSVLSMFEFTPQDAHKAYLTEQMQKRYQQHQLEKSASGG